MRPLIIAFSFCLLVIGVGGLVIDGDVSAPTPLKEPERRGLLTQSEESSPAEPYLRSVDVGPESARNGAGNAELVERLFSGDCLDACRELRERAARGPLPVLRDLITRIHLASLGGVTPPEDCAECICEILSQVDWYDDGTALEAVLGILETESALADCLLAVLPSAAILRDLLGCEVTEIAQVIADVDNPADLAFPAAVALARWLAEGSMDKWSELVRGTARSHGPDEALHLTLAMWSHLPLSSRALTLATASLLRFAWSEEEVSYLVRTVTIGEMLAGERVFLGFILSQRGGQAGTMRLREIFGACETGEQLFLVFAMADMMSCAELWRTLEEAGPSGLSATDRTIVLLHCFQRTKSDPKLVAEVVGRVLNNWHGLAPEDQDRLIRRIERCPPFGLNDQILARILAEEPNRPRRAETESGQ